MKMQAIRVVAKSLGINSFGKTKVGLIHEIQVAEGNFPCFGQAQDYCDQLQCAFRELCLHQPEVKSSKLAVSGRAAK